VTPGLRWTIHAAEARLRLQEIADALDELLAARGASERARFAARLVAEELVLNAFEHGGARSAILEAGLGGPRARLTIEDDGSPFDPTTHLVEPATCTAEEVRPRGRGLALVRGFTTGMEYRLAGGRNRLSLELTE
jgi:anti-sigma regulatory factor (Ser/Thr protein kinase)